MADEDAERPTRDSVATLPLRTRGVFEDAPSPYGAFASGLLGPMTTPKPMDASRATARSAAALEERKVAGEKAAEVQEKAGAEQRTAAADVETQSGRNAAERQAAKPPAMNLPPVPDLSARAFLTPPKGILDSLQTVMAAVGGLAMQIKGTRKGGSPTGAILAMQALADGWIKGDGERVKADYQKWKAESERLIEQHRTQRETYQDLIADQTMSMNERMQAIGLRAQAAGHQALAEQVRLGNIDATLKQLQHDEATELSIAQFNERAAQWYATAQQHERNFQAAQEQRRLLNEHRTREEGRHAANDSLRREMAGPFLKMQGQLLSNAQVLDDLGVMKVMVDRLNAAGLLQTTPSLWNELGAKFNQRFADDPALKEAMDWMQRLGASRLAAAEIAAGEPASALRLKAVGEAQIAHVLTVSPQFWDDFFKRTRSAIERQNVTLRKNIQAVNPGLLQRIDQIDAPTLSPISNEEWDTAGAPR